MLVMTTSNRKVIPGIVSRTYAVYILLISLIRFSLAKDIPAVFIFGDSGVDVGNNFYINSLARPVFPNGIDFGNRFGIPSGRYCNGRIYGDFIVQELGFKNIPPPNFAPTTVGDVLLTGVSYSSSSSGILNDTGSNLGARISLLNQINYFERTRQDIMSNVGIKAAQNLIAGAIYIVATGGNDIPGAAPKSNSSRDLAYSDKQLDTIVSVLRSRLSRLYNMGARKFVVPNCPTSGCIPFVTDIYLLPDGCAFVQNQIVQSYNSKLKIMLEELTKNLTGSLYVYADLYTISVDIILNYISYGFEDATNACCHIIGAHGGIIPCISISQVCQDRTKHVYWDAFHWTETANSIVAKHFMDGGSKYIQPMNIRQLTNTYPALLPENYTRN